MQTAQTYGQKFRPGCRQMPEVAAVPVDRLPNRLLRIVGHTHSRQIATPGALAVIDGTGAVRDIGLMGCDLEIAQRRAASNQHGEVRADALYALGSEGCPRGVWPRIVVMDGIEQD